MTSKPVASFGRPGKKLTVFEPGDKIYDGIPLDEMEEPSDSIKKTAMEHFVRDAFKPTSDDIMADIENKNRKEDKKLMETYRKISKIEKEFKEEIESQAWPENSKARDPKNLMERIGVRLVEKIGGFVIKVMASINRGLENGMVESPKGKRE